jgi:hypothetical protein
MQLAQQTGRHTSTLEPTAMSSALSPEMPSATSFRRLCKAGSLRICEYDISTADHLKDKQAIITKTEKNKQQIALAPVTTNDPAQVGRCRGKQTLPSAVICTASDNLRVCETVQQQSEYDCRTNSKEGS